MLEWLKRHAWKACKLQKGFRGSNPRLSANFKLEYKINLINILSHEKSICNPYRAGYAYFR